MRDYKPPYSVIGVSLDSREQAVLRRECERTGIERSLVIKRALKYVLELDPEVRDEVIINS